MARPYTFIYDNLLLMKDAGLIAASAAATVSSVARIFNLGASLSITGDNVPPNVSGELVVDITAIEVASTDEYYLIIVQGSNSATFASGIQNLAVLEVGALAARKGGAIGSTVGRHVLPWRNSVDDTVYQYIRVYTFVAGTIATGINYTAFLSIPNPGC